MASKAYESLHILMFPFMAQGHMIPMIDIARLLAGRGATVTVVTTLNNALRFKHVFSRATESGLKLNLVSLEFPSEEAGLPKGCDNVDSLPSTALIDNFHRAVSALHGPVERLLRDLPSPQPSCVISDMFLPWTIHIANRLGVPRVSFHGTSSFVLFCVDLLHSTKIQENYVGSENEYFVIPGLRHRIEATLGQIPENRHNSKNPTMINQVFDAEDASYGVIVNTFEELEPEYSEGFKALRNGKVWCLGPASLYNKEQSDKAQRGQEPAEDVTCRCLTWLDAMQPGSVAYVCLGSLCNLRAPQLIELGLGLEASNRPFVWVIRGGGGRSGAEEEERLERWISEERFEERVSGRGLLIRGWAPQVLILSHPSVGGFLTHCGWNSTLEGISAGLPLLTWPLFGDQFLNEKLVAQVLQVAVTLGVEEPMAWGEEDKVAVKVKRETIKSGLERLLDAGDEVSRERKRRARKLRDMAKTAVENGGSSHRNITSFLDDLVSLEKPNNDIKYS